MDMQDKEFDRLFRSKLEDLETEPSNGVWQGINESLGNNRRRKFIPFLSIAASIIVLIAAGFLFIPKKENVVKLSGKTHAKNLMPAKIVAPVVLKQQPIIALITNVVPTIQAVHLYHKGNKHTLITPVKQDMITKNESPVPPNNQQVLAVTSSSKTEVKQISAIDSSGTLAAVKPSVQNAVTTAAFPGKQTTALPQTGTIAPTPQVKKHGIRGIGDVLNVVIAAVDKRKDKIIEFDDTDGDGASITAVNLGIIKVKKEN